ncbi:MAG: hypothetical protein ACRCWR_04715 [Saezia sp.]
MMVDTFRSRLINILFVLVLGCLGLTMLATEAFAQNYHARVGGPYGRVFPDAAFRGRLEVVSATYVMLDGKRERLAPGSRIMDTKNRLIMPNRIIGQRKVVNYVRFRDGKLHTLWLLTPKEMRERRKSADPKWWEKLYQSMEPWIDLAKWYGLGQVGL